MTPSHAPSAITLTRVGLHLGALASRVEALGEVRDWPEGARLCEKGGTDRVLHVVLDGELPTRLRKFAPDVPSESEYCDHDHPAIRTLARALRGPDAAATATRIWAFVRDLPYRFGPWWMKASETLRAGWGMCTTKSNLEVALFRAAGLEAGFVEMHIDATLLKPLLPPAWHHCVHSHARAGEGVSPAEGLSSPVPGARSAA